MVILGLNRPIEEFLAEHGRRGLSRLHGIGERLAFTIETLVIRTASWCRGQSAEPADARASTVA